MTLIISCEHASNRVPDQLAPLFRDHGEELAGHRAYDLGAAQLARFLANAMKAPLFLSSVSRLVVDCNRSTNHRRLFSKFSRCLPPLERETIMTEWYLPYRGEVYREVKQTVAHTGCCLHLSVHTFTPELNGRERNAELGLLYDPSRSREHLFARALQKELHTAMPSCRVRRNYPYRGVSDGLSVALRRSFDEQHYLGIELEVNQTLLSPSNHWPETLPNTIASSLQKAMAGSFNQCTP